jgi:GNAT superfamily N-acetyltransferase
MCWHDDAKEPQEVGNLEAVLIALHRAADPWETLDSRSSELEGLHSHVFGQYAGVMRPSVARIYDRDGHTDMFWDPVLYVEKIEVEVAHRGRGVGLRTMNALLTHFRPHATLAFCKPYPLHREVSQETSDTKGPRYFDRKPAQVPIGAAVGALSRYWARAGFKKLGRGPYYVVNLKARQSA